jgi:protein tyrosine/serine phosphatase
MHGADRTGVVSAMYRVVYDNWDKKRAIDEMRNGGFGFHEVWKNIVEYVEKVDVNAIKLSVGK